MTTTVDVRTEIGYGNHTESIIDGAVSQIQNSLESYQTAMQNFDADNPSLNPLGLLAHYQAFQLGLNAVINATNPDNTVPVTKSEFDKAIAYSTVRGIDIIKTAVGNLQPDHFGPSSPALQKDTPAGELVYLITNGRLVQASDPIKHDAPTVSAMNNILQNLEILLNLPGVAGSLDEQRSLLLKGSGYKDPATAKTNRTRLKVEQILRQNPGGLSKILFDGTK